MLKPSNTENAQAYCVDGDIKRVAGRIIEATVSYLRAYSIDEQFTAIHIDALDPLEGDEIIVVLENWLKTDEESRAQRKKYSVRASPGEIWNFIFALNTEAVTTCFVRIEPLFAENCYIQIVDCCNAIIDHYPDEAVHILLHRALAYTLMEKHEKEAVSDYLQAFIKNKTLAIQVTRSKHGQYLPQITNLFRNFIYSPMFNAHQESKRTRKWIQLTADCCRFLLSLDAINFQLQMTFAERLTLIPKPEQAIAYLNEVISNLQLDHVPDIRKLAECCLRMGYSYLLKNQSDVAVAHITRGLNSISDKMASSRNNNSTSSIQLDTKKNRSDKEYDITLTFLEDNHEVQYTAKLARDILNPKSGDLNNILILLDKAASKLNSNDKNDGILRLDNAQKASELYRAILVFRPKHRNTLTKLALCYSKLGRHNYAIKIYDSLLSRKDYVQDSNILSARATCYREIGKKMEARKDYDILLRDSPKDAGLLFERSLVHMENNDIESLVFDLQTACKSNQRTVSICMNKLPLIQKTRLRQILFDHSETLLKNVCIPEPGEKRVCDQTCESAAIMALAITQLMTKLNSADISAHILKAHALFYTGSVKDAEVSLKRLLQDNPENLDNQVIRWHLGLLRILSQRVHEGMLMMIKVLENKGEQLFTRLLRGISVHEGTCLSEEAYRYAIGILQTKKEFETVRNAAHCFTIGVLCCRVNDISYTGLDQNVDACCRFYLARAECMAHLGDQQTAVLDFTAALEVNPNSVEGLCGRALMLLALGDEHNCIDDIISAALIDTFTVTAHISALPEEAKKLLLHWLDHCIVSNLLQCGHKTNSLDCIYGTDHISTSSLRIDSPCTPQSFEKPGRSHHTSGYLKSTPQQEIENDDIMTAKQIECESDVSLSPVMRLKSPNSLQYNNQKSRKEQNKNRRKSKEYGEEIKYSFLEADGKVSTEFSDSSSFVYDDIITGMEKAEFLERAHLLGKLLIYLDSANAVWQGMFADILVVKGDFDEALHHLRIVMELTPADVTAIARAVLINIKLNRYRPAIILLSMLARFDEYGLLYILRALDLTRSRLLSSESNDIADTLKADENYTKAIELYSLSLHSSNDHRIEKLRKRAKCYAKIRENSCAIEDMSLVIKETEQSVRAGDYCSRAYNYLIINKEQEACHDYKTAIKIDRDEAYLQIHAKPGRTVLSRIFYRHALEEFGRQEYMECVDTCDHGVFIDGNQIDMRKLRARANRKVASCIIQ